MRMAKRLFPNRRNDYRAQRRLERTIKRTWKDRLRSELKDAADKAAEAVEADGDPVAAIGQHESNLERLFTGMYEDTMGQFGRRILDAGAKAIPNQIETKDAEGRLQQAMRAFISSVVGRKVEQVSTTTKSQIMRAVEKGRSEDLGTQAIAQNIRTRLGDRMARLRSEVIARTEVHGAGQYGQNEAAKALGAGRTRKQWMDAGDGRERRTHADASGQTRAMEEKFDVGGDRLSYPGDPEGSAAEVILCRCAQSFIVD